MTLNTALALNAVTNSRNKYLDILDAAWADHLAPRQANAPTVISTFAGCGGSSLGYSMAGYHELLAVEWDNNAVETFRLNFPDVPVYHGDIAKLSVSQCLEMTGLKAGELDVFDGSPPCQGFSTAGKRDMSDDRNQLFREYVRLLRGLQPKAFVMENVSGMVKGKMKLIFAEILTELKASGYQVSARLLNAMYFNVPQSRERMIFIGVRNDLGIAPSHPKAESNPFTVANAFYGIPTNQDLNGTELKDTWNMTRVLRGLEKHTHFSLIILNPNKPSNALPKSIEGTTSGFIHPNRMRKVSITEAKRLTSIPDDFQITGSFFAKWNRIGNSVPPLFMRSIARHIRIQILDTMDIRHAETR